MPVEANISARRSRRLFFRLIFLALLSLVLLPSSWGAAPDDSITNLPAAVDLRPVFQKWGLPLRSQGGRGTCSVFALTGALEYALASRQQTGTVLSVEFLNWASNRATANSGDGGFFSDLWAGYEHYGICPESELPYSKIFDPKLRPDKAALQQAKETSGANLQLHWIKPWNATTGLTNEQFLQIKRTLARGWPVCGGFRWPKHEVWQNDILQMVPAAGVFDGLASCWSVSKTMPASPAAAFF